ncbi:hypothetical protein HanHA89_Chr02g0041831 [Helianthus annuus]|nr:hypothetical protein HanHA89_Chr02g0041831 [Helianthus annuus]
MECIMSSNTFFSLTNIHAYCTVYLPGSMSSSSSSDLSEVDPMLVVSDDEYGPDIIIISSDDESEHDVSSDDDYMLDDFQPFALAAFGEDPVPPEDDVLAMPQLLHGIIIYGHPEGEHMIVHLPEPLAAVPFVDLEDDDDVDIPVIHVEHLDDDLGDGEIHDIVILELPSPVVSVVDISSTASSVAPSTHTPASSPDTVLPAQTAVPPTPSIDPMRLPGFPHSMYPPPHYQSGPSSYQPMSSTPQDPYAAGPSQPAGLASDYARLYAEIPPPGMDPSDPYHPSHFSPTTMVDRMISYDIQFTILFRRVRELDAQLAAVLAAITPPPPASPQPPLPVSPPPSPPPLPQSPPPPSPH